MRGREDGDNFSNEVKIHICHYESFQGVLQGKFISIL
jgi:hypothetical protein